MAELNEGYPITEHLQVGIGVDSGQVLMGMPRKQMNSAHEPTIKMPRNMKYSDQRVSVMP